MKYQTQNTIGWIGLGVMGRSMVSHLQNAGFATFVHSRTKEKAAAAIAQGATWCDTPAEVTTNSDTVFTMLGFPKDVEDVYFAANGILAAAKPGMLLVDMTTTKPSLACRIFEQSRSQAIEFLDAPVSGGDIGARTAQLSIMVGGEVSSFERAKPFFSHLGKNIVHQGKAGSGQHAKMSNQLVIASTMVGVCEALLYAKKAGLSPEILLQSITKGAAGCWTLDHLAPRMMAGNFEPGFLVEHFLKDLEIALEEATRLNLSLPGLALARSLYEKTVRMGLGQKGTHALLLALSED